MKKLMLPLVLGTLMVFSSLTTYAQFANVQLIHNSPDPAADSVDVYVNGTKIADNFPFRGATGFLQVPAGVQVNVGIAAKNSISAADTLKNFPYVLGNGQTVTAIASGVLNPAAFDTTVNGAANLAFDVKVLSPALTNPTGNQTTLVAFHGAPDAPAVDVIANGGMMPLIGNLGFNTFSGIATVPAAEYVLDVNVAGTSTTAATYYVNLFPALASGNAVIFASGFLNPANNQNGEPFGLFAALADGTVLPLTTVGNARVQVIHNVADPAADTVDIYVNWITDSLKLDNFAFRSATPFVDLPTGYEIDIQIAPKNSTSSSDRILDFSAPFMDGQTYHVVANGVVDPSQFATNPDGRTISTSLLVSAGAREAASAGDVDLRVLHASTDAPTVGVNANGGAIVPAAAYGDLTGYLGVPAAEYRIDVTAPNDPSTLIAPFYVDLSGLTGGAGIVFASGFLNPAANQNGPAFGLFAALPDGTVAELTAVGSARAQVIHNSADLAADTVDVYINTLADTIFLDDFAFRTATPFVDVPTEYPLQIVIAPANSTGIGDGIATIPATLANGESYHIVANGVLDPGTYAANPDGESTAFTLFAVNGAQEAAVNTSNVELRVFHGATDAPTVDVLANLSTPALVSGLTYGDFQGYLSVPAADYQLGVTTAGGGVAGLVAQFLAPATGLQGGAGIILASGFLTPADNQNGEAFGLLLVLADGTSILLSNTTGLFEELPVNNDLLNVYPNPARRNVNLTLEVDNVGQVDVAIFDMAGRIVWSRSETLVPGQSEWTLDATNIAAGIHTVVLKTETSIATKKLVLVK